MWASLKSSLSIVFLLFICQFFKIIIQFIINVL